MIFGPLLGGQNRLKTVTLLDSAEIIWPTWLRFAFFVNMEANMDAFWPPAGRQLGRTSGVFVNVFDRHPPLPEYWPSSHFSERC